MLILSTNFSEQTEAIGSCIEYKQDTLKRTEEEELELDIDEGGSGGLASIFDYHSCAVLNVVFHRRYPWICISLSNGHVEM